MQDIYSFDQKTLSNWSIDVFLYCSFNVVTQNNMVSIDVTANNRVTLFTTDACSINASKTYFDWIYVNTPIFFIHFWNILEMFSSRNIVTLFNDSSYCY